MTKKEKLKQDVNELFHNSKIKVGQQLVIMLTDLDGSFSIRANCDNVTLKSNLLNAASQID